MQDITRCETTSEEDALDYALVRRRTAQDPYDQPDHTPEGNAQEEAP